eukprot:COSAG01_NODE_646_length_14556_cov_9.736806_10_plen_154_part_00
MSCTFACASRYASQTPLLPTQTDNGAFQLWGNAFDQVIASNVNRRMGGSFSWGQWHGNRTASPLTVSSIAPNMRQLWLENEVLDENGVRNYMASARHTHQGAASVASLLAAILTEIHLCKVCSCQEILRRNGLGQEPACATSARSSPLNKTRL